ncbi:MAG TPA: hypothetical protein VN253_22415 [Kofleriaceae bacterium]|nr:hypothetical protein [Kofleriaceae bacterium]
MEIESAPFELEVTPRLLGSRNTNLRSGDKVVTRDKIKITARTSVDTHLYLAYCARDRRLAFYPSEGSIEAKAGKTTYAPDQKADIVLDDQIGPEVLYVIASRRRLDLADPELAAAMSKVRPGAANVDCGAPLEQVLAMRRPARSDLGHAPGTAAGRAARVPPPAELDRGGYIKWTDAGEVSAGGDRDGIVVVRYNFTHVDSLASP